jgi:hypothetical protein
MLKFFFSQIFPEDLPKFHHKLNILKWKFFAKHKKKKVVLDRTVEREEAMIIVKNNLYSNSQKIRETTRTPLFSNVCESWMW